MPSEELGGEFLVRFTRDPQQALAALGDWLAAEAVERERAAGLVHGMARRKSHGHFWWVESQQPNSAVSIAAAVVLGSDGRAEVVGDVEECLRSLAEALSVEASGLLAIRGPAQAVEPLGGELATLLSKRAEVGEPRRGMRVTSVDLPQPPPGRRRLASEGDIQELIVWIAAFDRETGTEPSPEFNRAVIEGYTRRGQLHVWESEGRLVATTAVYDVVPQVGRLVFVYTSPECRGRGFGARLVSEVAEEVLKTGLLCILYADPANPTAVRMYERIGFRKFADLETVTLHPLHPNRPQIGA